MKRPVGLLKGIQNVASAGIAIFGIHCHTAPDNGFEWSRKRVRDKGSFYRKTPGEHLIEDNTERVDVVAWSGNTIEAFGGHIGEGAYLVSRRRQWRTGRRALLRGDPKVDETHVDLRGPFLVVEQDITRLEVAVNNAPAMDVFYRLHQRSEELPHFCQRQH